MTQEVTATSSASAGGRSAAIMLSSVEIAAIADIIAGTGPTRMSQAANAGFESLEARDLIVQASGGYRPSDRLAATLAPIMLPEEVVGLVHVGGGSQLFFARRGVYATVVDVNDQIEVRVADLSRMITIATDCVADPESAEAIHGTPPTALQALRGQMDDLDIAPPVTGASMVYRRRIGGGANQATVIAHETGYTWMESDEREAAAVADTRSDLEMLVAEFLGRPHC